MVKLETTESNILIEDAKSKKNTKRKFPFKFSLSNVIIGLTLLIFITILFAPVITNYKPNTNDLTVVLQAPSFTHWLGTDHLGRDIFTRILYGGQQSLMIALIVQAISITVGALLGLISGYVGGRTDKFIMALTNIIFSFPGILFAIAIMAAMGTSIFNLILALSLVSWPEMCRLVRSQTMALKEREFVEGGHALGAGNVRILFKYILPNCYGNIMVIATIGIASTILAEASLSFLGLGVQPPNPSWGSMVNTGKDYVYQAPWYLFAPGIAMFITILGINLIGDKARDYFDPKM